jgi:tetrapyrrole methylase family protein/MazG family protein
MNTDPLNSVLEQLAGLIRLVATLRGENGCPWDRKQTPHSITNYLTEETYELMDAIEGGRPAAVCEELGDVVFHVFFIARIFEENGQFTISDVIRQITEKMIRRHPHVFGNDRVDGTEAVRKRWHEIKKQEKAAVGGTVASLLDSIPVQLPALMRAYRISERAGRAGFDWTDIGGVMQKVEEEWAEFKEAVSEKNPENAALEFGDILFTLTNVARFARIHPETALVASVKKFERRFRKLEARAQESGASVETLSQAELNAIWEEIKREE